jgi:hypothetical protein
MAVEIMAIKKIKPSNLCDTIHVSAFSIFFLSYM